MTTIQRYLYFLLVVLLALLNACARNPQAAVSTTAPIEIEMPVTVEVTRIVPVETRGVTTVEVTRIVRVYVTMTPVPTNTPGEVLAENAKFTGSYQWIGKVEGQGCTLKVKHTTYRQPVSKIDFELECNRGAPSYNFGYASGTMNEMGNVAVYNRYEKITNETCNLA